MLLILLLCLTPFSADRVEIIRKEGESIVHLIGNVVIEDENTKITCAEANLNETKDYVILTRDVKIIDKNGEINSNFAIYYFNEKKGYLRDSVILVTDNEIISADSLYYNGTEELVEMFSNVQLEDEKNNLIAYGGHGWYDLKKDEGYLLDSPSLEIMREEKEPMKIRAREFKLMTVKNVFYGFDSIVAIIDSFIVYCDTFSFNLKTEEGCLVNPFIVEKDNELKGETGRFSMKDSNIEAFSVQKGWSKYYTEEGSKNIVEGEEISVIFRQGRASKIIVDGNPSGVLTMKRKEEGAEDKEPK